MTQSIYALLAIAAALTLPACTQEQRAQTMPPGKYESTTKTTDDHGTTTVQKNTTEVEVDEHGDKKTVIKTKTTKDPRGLFNKQTSETTKVLEEDRY